MSDRKGRPRPKRKRVQTITAALRRMLDEPNQLEPEKTNREKLAEVLHKMRREPR